MGLQEAGWLQKWDAGERERDESTAAEDGCGRLGQPRPRGAKRQTVLAQGRALVETENPGGGSAVLPPLHLGKVTGSSLEWDSPL